jgi:hypothetical protein
MRFLPRITRISMQIRVIRGKIMFYDGMFHGVRKVGYTFGHIMIRMDVRILRISQLDTDFFYFLLETKHWG